jgi:hypothetical protein
LRRVADENALNAGPASARENHEHRHEGEREERRNILAARFERHRFAQRAKHVITTKQQEICHRRGRERRALARCHMPAALGHAGSGALIR